MQEGPQSHFEMFPDELLLHILSFVGLQVPKMRLVNHQFKGLLEEKSLWVNLVQRFLTDKCLKQIKEQEACPIEQLKSFLKQYKILAKRSHTTTIQLLNALDGDISITTSEELRTDAKMFLLVVAATHGSDEAWSQLEFSGKISTLVHCARLGYLHRLQELLTKENVESGDMNWILETAIKHENLDVIQFLLVYYRYKDTQIKTLLATPKLTMEIKKALNDYLLSLIKSDKIFAPAYDAKRDQSQSDEQDRILDDLNDDKTFEHRP